MKIKKGIAFGALLTVFLILVQFQVLPVFALEFSTQKITVPNTDKFGWSVQQIDSGLAVGEPFGDSNSGKVYIFDSGGGLTSTITNPNVDADNFGYSLSALGNLLAIGAPGYDSDKGIVYLYAITDPSDPLLSITNPSNLAGERMGEDAMNFIEGDLLVGVSKAENDGNSQAGIIYQFSTSDGSLGPVYSDPSVDIGNMFGRSISVASNLFLTGAHGTNGEEGSAQLLGSSSLSLSNPNTASPAGDKYGWSTEITPGKYLVGAPNAEVFYSGSDTVTQGKVYLHHADEALTDVINSPDIADLDLSQNVEDQFGYALSESDGFIVVSAPYDDVEMNGQTYLDAGSVYLYSGSGYPLVTMHNPDPEDGDLFGHSLEIVNGFIVIGAPGDEGNTGAVYYLTISNDFALTLSIGANPNPVQSGGTTEITYTIKNVGTVDLFDAVLTIDSPTCPSIDGPFVNDEDDGILQPGEEWTYTCQVTVVAPFTESVIEDSTTIFYYPDPFEDPLTISCDDPNFECSSTVNVTLLEEATALEISAVPDTIYTGEHSAVTFTVTNGGNTARYINDGEITVQGCEPIVDDSYPIEIIPQASIDFTCDIEGGTATEINIIADVTTSDENNENLEVISNSFTINVIAPAIMLDISSDPNPTYDGEETTITYTITNTGNAPVTIHDNVVENSGACTPTTDTTLPITLQQNDVILFTCTITAGLTQIELDATATATAENESQVSDNTTLTIPIIAPEISLDISSDPNPVTSGATSLVTYTITNTNIAPVTIDSQTDLVENSGACTPTTDTTLPITLQQNDNVIFTCTITAGLSDISLNAEATATDQNGREVQASATHELTVIPNIVLSGIIRDFKISHPDFEYKIADDDGIVKTNLGADGKPLYNGNPFTGTVTTTGLVNYNQWYNHVSGINDCIQHDITLMPTTSGTFKYANSTFFPIDNKLFGNELKLHNYHFTYQIRATFVYQSGQTITMTGDDDIWVFIDNKLALDQGGVLPPRTGTIDLDGLSLIEGQTYSFDLFYAERHTVQSNLGIETNIPLISSIPAQCNAVDAVNDSAFAISGPNEIDVTNNDVGASSISAFTQGMHGSASLSDDESSLEYTPDLGFEGIDLFTYSITNTSGSTDTAVVTMIVLADATCPLPVSSYNLIMGDDSNNKLVGTNSDDLILGNGGNDKIYGKKGNDCLVGGSGNDKIWGSDGNDTIISGSGNDQLQGQQGDDTLFGGSGDDKIYGSKGNDIIDAGAGNDRVNANQGNDVVTGGEGNDWLAAGIGNDIVNGGTGNDKIYGRPGNDILNGDAGDDFIHAGQGDDIVNGGDNTDKIYGHQGNDVLNGNNGDDYIHGGQGNDGIDGGDGSDRCYGAQGNNTINNCEVEDKKMKEEQEENDDDEGESGDDNDDKKDKKDKKDK